MLFLITIGSARAEVSQTLPRTEHTPKRTRKPLAHRTRFQRKRETFYILLTFALGAMAVSWALIFSNVNGQLAVLGILIVSVATLLADTFIRIEKRLGIMEDIAVEIDGTPELLTFYESTTESFKQTFGYEDSKFRDFIDRKIERFVSDLESEWKDETVSFTEETWPLAYQQLVGLEDVKDYKSVAWVKSDKYWQDPAGKRLHRWNYELASSGRKNISRIFILSPNVMNSEGVKEMIRAHDQNNITIMIAKENELPALLRFDIGIYQRRAVGYLDSDAENRTQKFQVHFSQLKVIAAETLYDALKIYCLDKKEVDHFLGKEKSPLAATPG